MPSRTTIWSRVSRLLVSWSEASVIATGCGQLALADWLERSAYGVVLVVAGSCWFCRLAFGQSLATITRFRGALLAFLAAEALSYLSVVGALVALASQVLNGSQMDGLSGIDIEMCRTTPDISSVAFSWRAMQTRVDLSKQCLMHFSSMWPLSFQSAIHSCL